MNRPPSPLTLLLSGHTRRREVIVLLGGGAIFGPRAGMAQPAGPVRRIGLLSPQCVSSAAPLLAGLRRGLRDLGWIEGRNIVFELRYADGRIDHFPGLAAELVRQNVEVIVAGSNPGTLAAKQATGAIPIVMATTGDPIAGGLVESLARPGANVTGVTAIAQELSAKRLELLKEAVSGLSRVAVLTNPDSPYTALYLKDATPAAHSLGLELQIVEARSAVNRLQWLDPARKASLMISASTVSACAWPPRIAAKAASNSSIIQGT